MVCETQSDAIRSQIWGSEMIDIEIGDEILVKSTWYTVERVVPGTSLMECVEQDTGEWDVIDYDDVDHVAIRTP